MNRPFLFAGDLIAKCGKHSFSEIKIFGKVRKHLLINRNTNIFFDNDNIEKACTDE
tara:strand:+ start:265 stop:432 length:168 start_codon:yes stop_codon:yes gene_type:complete